MTDNLMTNPGPPVQSSMPKNWRIPFVYSSPHSGNKYPAEFLDKARPSIEALIQSEDSFVDQLFSTCPASGAPLLAALFPRIFCDPNRQAYELDPQMYSDSLPSYVLTRSLRLSNGLGTIARYTADGQPIYKKKLTFEEAKQRIHDFYLPFHQQLQQLLAEGLKKFGFVVLVDCHSMPSRSRKAGKLQKIDRPDFILGDRFGLSCHGDIMELASSILQDLGYEVVRNIPYAGGYITEHYGQPAQNIHSLQIEINRALYMDEDSRSLKPGYTKLVDDLGVFVKALGQISLPAKMDMPQ